MANEKVLNAGAGREIPVLYEDGEILVLYKPGGVPVQTRRVGEKDLTSIIKNYRAIKGEEPYIAVIQRLDQPVEGVLLFAKTKGAAADLNAQMQAGHIEKCYRAVVFQRKDAPLSQGECGVLTDYLLKDGRANLSKVVCEGTLGAKKAVFRYTVLRANADLAELSIQLETGRHHQIRAQMAHAGMPLAGDRKYGQGELLRAGQTICNVALCAAGIGFRHPYTDQKMKFETEPRNPAFQLLYA